MMIPPYHLDQPQHQSQKGYRVQSSATILDLQNHIKKYLDDDSEIQFYFEKDKLFSGVLNTYLINIIKNIPGRTIYYRKVSSHKNTHTQSYKSSKFEYESQNNDIKQSNQNISTQSQIIQGEYQLNKPVNIQNQQEQNSLTKIQHSQNNYINRGGVKADAQPIQQAKPQSTIDSRNIQSNVLGTENLRQQVQSQIYSNLTRSQLQNQELQQLKQEKYQTDQQNQELQSQVNKLKTRLLDYEERIRNQQTENEKIRSDFKDQNQQIQYDLSKLKDDYEKLNQENGKLKIENQKLSNENDTLQKNLGEAKLKPQTYIEVQKDNSNNQPKLRIQEISPLERTKEQNPLQSSQIYQSQCYNTGYQQKSYKNKCGHNIDISQIEALLTQALKNNSKALCKQCQKPIQSKLCLLTEFGKQYLEANNQKDLKLIFQNLQRKQLKSQEKLVKCSTVSCQFFCIWQQNQNLRFPQQKNGLCLQCLSNSVIGNELQASTHQDFQNNASQYGQQEQYRQQKQFGQQEQYRQQQQFGQQEQFRQQQQFGQQEQYGLQLQYGQQEQFRQQQQFGQQGQFRQQQQFGQQEQFRQQQQFGQQEQFRQYRQYG
ncbi:unnamed protein product (macronuclear) [Paramecium tetraurelia]|uniref:Uncharacterized protein n=1 Tax=Paramecium tetraurelia TaxID=5888 RepID=A0C7P0_PARTE|nr:uncharacterized protein GSPATT00035937001 [Paramecium tetraurelia]CAK66807.1 unnamed protein product [Paramecium tetraurelia]|eukprot:XP_001434204.1 hypothetical protein (macronuclear) [Paramecium tetraurelia strain d4-2]